MEDTVLIIDDEKDILDLVEYNLKDAGYKVMVCPDGRSGLQMARDHRPDLIILDLMLPEMDGKDVCKQLKKDKEMEQVPVIMLTAKTSELDRVVGLELGADDYVTKPFSPKLVVARVRALLRRSDAASNVQQVVRVGDLEIDLEGHTVQQGEKALELTPTEFNLLAALASQPGRVFSRLQLLEAGPGAAYEGYERTIDAHIKNLRAKLESDPKKPQYIETVFGVGYRFIRPAG